MPSNKQTSSGRRPIAVALLLLAAGAAPAAALTVTAPNAASLPRNTPISVQWTSTQSGWQYAGVTVWQVTPSAGQVATLMAVQPNTGQLTVILPASLPCGAGHSYRLRVELSFNWNVQGDDVGESAPFQLACPGLTGGLGPVGVSQAAGNLTPANRQTAEGDSPGRLRVVKEIVNTTGRPTPAGAFRLNIDCSSGPDFTVSAAAPSNLAHSFAIPSSVRCTVSEPYLPPTPAPCRWVVSYPAGQTGGPGQTVVVRNTLVCGSASTDRK